jgi:hypothetical protein
VGPGSSSPSYISTILGRTHERNSRAEKGSLGSCLRCSCGFVETERLRDWGLGLIAPARLDNYPTSAHSSSSTKTHPPARTRTHRWRRVIRGSSSSRTSSITMVGRSTAVRVEPFPTSHFSHLLHLSHLSRLSHVSLRRSVSLSLGLSVSLSLGLSVAPSR